MNIRIGPPTTNPPINKFSPRYPPLNECNLKKLETLNNGLPGTPMWTSNYNVGILSIKMCPINAQNNLVSKAKVIFLREHNSLTQIPNLQTP